MIKYCLSSTYRKHYTDLEKLKMLSDQLDVQPYDLGQYILKTQKDNAVSRSKSPTKANTQTKIQNDTQMYFTQLIADLEVFKCTVDTPIKLFKSLLLIHCCFLLVTSQPNQQVVNYLNSYFKWVLEQATKMIEKFSKKQNSKRKSVNLSALSKIGIFSGKKEQSNFQSLQETKSVRTKSSSAKNTSRPKSTSKYGSQQILSKQICLLASVIKPYILYLQKVLSIYSIFQSLLHSIPNKSVHGSIQTSQQSSWIILNIFKLISGVTQNFNYIGRYFYKQYYPIVYLLIQFFNKQVSRLYPILRTQARRRISNIQHEFFVLQQQYSEYQIYHNDQIQIQGASETMMFVDQILKVNESLFHLYLGKYFHQVVQKLGLNEPRWFKIHSKQCEFLIHYNKMKYKNGTRGKSVSKGARSSSLIKNTTQSKPFSVQNIQNKDLKSRKTPCSQQLEYKIVLQKKNMVPKIKNQLKLNANQKQNKQKMDTITFRGKQSFNKQLDQSKTLGDESIRNKNELQKIQGIDTLRTKVRSYQVLEVQQ